jgi:hypothetical protein
MSHPGYSDRARFTPELTRPSLGRQIINGVTGIAVLMALAVVVVIMVIWKSP